MKILLTGHLGYIGTVLSPLLLERGHDVHGLDSNLFADCTFDGHVENLPLIGRDLRDFVLRNDAVVCLRGFDAVIHLAGLSNDPLGDYRPELTSLVNTDSSMALARVAKDAGVERFVFASSCSNYGASSDKFIDESGNFNPITPYGQSKVDVEIALRKLAGDDFSPTFLRASTAYGVSPRLRFDLVVNNLSAWALTTGEVHLKSDGEPWRPIVHVEDICRAYIATVEAPREDVHLQAFNVGLTTENYQIKEIAEIVRDAVPNSQLGFADDAGPDTRNYRVDCNYIGRTLHNFKPQWTCRRGVEQLLEAFNKAELTFETFQGQKFKRIAHIKHRIQAGTLSPDLRDISTSAQAGAKL